MPKASLLTFIELNEVNFDYVRFYIAKGRLPALAQLLRRHGVAETRSEQLYEHIEPWIQWVTAHTGRTYAEHGVFRLGDIVHHEIPQIWEMLEKAGIKVGAVSPMNGKHRVRDPAFFVPDPWTPTEISARPSLVALYRALAQVVNDNAQGRVTLQSLLRFAYGFLAYARTRNYGRYLRLLARARSSPWCKALFLDLLLADVFISEVRRTRPGFATLFLNGAAHIQHHYMFCSAAYAGPQRNPDWYVDRTADPILDAYSLYDDIIGDVQRTFPAARVMLATGLHQDPHEQLTYYWRLKDHAGFLRSAAIEFTRVEPRMSRDFVVVCSDTAAADRAAATLRTAVAADGTPLFEIDNRGSDLFVMLTYPHEIRSGLGFTIGGRSHPDLYPLVAFVALKNGEHNGTGYFLDTGAAQGSMPAEFPLADMPRRVMEALNVDAAARHTA